MVLSERLKQLRLNEGISQLKLADEIGISVHSINSYESGRREPNSKAMAKLEDYFGVSGAYLRGEEEPNAVHSLVHPNLNHVISTSHPQCVQDAVNLIYEATGVEQAMYNKLLQSFAKLTKAGQKEMIKRVKEYTIVEKQKEEPKNAQKNSHPKDDYELSYVIAAKSGTWQSGIGREEILDEVKELTSENPDL